MIQIAASAVRVPWYVCIAVGWFLLFVALCGNSAAEKISAQELVKQVVHNELQANENDHSHWMYRDSDTLPAKSTVKLVVQTPKGTVSKVLLLNGHPLTAQQRAQDDTRMESILTDPSVLEKQRKSSAHDSQQAVSLMKMLPNGFLWSYAGESNGEITLDFKPNPAFQPPTYASRVFAAMAGQMVLDAGQKRLKVLSGKLIQTVEFGWGLFGQMNKGGTFRVVRSQLAPGIWEITETHVHIQGHMLIFKSINEQEDEISSDYKKTPPSMTLREAIDQLKNGQIAKELGIQPEK
ncbi:MAG TPA: hypothetical protein VE195_03085 [Acidobacteriaceae bacterium]|nr:hypothetical protein [Acidobacteriaceae bacterium]